MGKRALKEYQTSYVYSSQHSANPSNYFQDFFKEKGRAEESPLCCLSFKRRVEGTTRRVAEQSHSMLIPRTIQEKIICDCFKVLG